MIRNLSGKLIFLLLPMGLLLMAGTGVYAQSSSVTPTAKDDPRPAGWSEATHSNKVDPNYAVVFPQNKVNQMTITITPENWAAMQANMIELLGEPGSRRMGPGGARFGDANQPNVAQPTSPLAPPNGAQPTSPLPPPDGRPLPGNGEPPTGFSPPGGGGPGFGGGDMTPENPMWVTATIEFAGDTWTNVGVRYKGNSSLRSSWDNKSLKLPFKLDFDQFEDEYPAIDNQRFYGFKQLSLANGFGDVTYMRDAITYDLLDAAGLVAAETAFYEISIDYGDGPVKLGIYTMIEVIDDTVVERSFADDSGNIYEADGRAASLAEGVFDQIEESFQKENNEDEADWSDIEALYTVLHAAERTTDPAAWRAALEAVFDVDTFLEWLALSAALQHWDTYGNMTHNYYLYHNPDTDQLTWISWDHNLVLGSAGGGMQPGGNAPNTANPGGEAGGMRGRNRTVSFDKAEVNDSWPLIRYLLDDPTYYASYLAYLEEISTTVFDAAQLEKQYTTWAKVLLPYVESDSQQAAFETAVQGLIDRTYERAKSVETFLANQ